MAGVRALIGVTVAATLVAGVAAGADTRIRPGKGIGKIDIGMTEAQVRSRLGRPGAVRERQVGFGNRFLEWQYEDGFFTVGLLGRPGRMRVHSVGTLYRSERTPQGFGVGTPEARLARAYGVRLRCGALRTFPGSDQDYAANRTRDCIVRSAGGETVYVTAPRRGHPGIFVTRDEWRRYADVLEVRVRRGPLPS
jgi:hypothetical protein